MVLQYEYFNETQNLGRDLIGWMALNTASPSQNDRIAKAIDQMFANSLYETSTDTEKAFNKAFAAQLGNIALIVALVVGAAFATILMIVGNTMTAGAPTAFCSGSAARFGSSLAWRVSRPATN